MSSINSDPIVVPAPRPVSDDRLLVNIPLATTNNAGVATYDKEQFNVLGGKVSLKRDYFRKNFNDKFEEYRKLYDASSVTASEYADSANESALLAKASATEAGVSATRASGSEIMAEYYMKVSRDYKNNAYTYSTEALLYKNNANIYANEATRSAVAAEASEEAATRSAVAAESSAQEVANARAEIDIQLDQNLEVANTALTVAKGATQALVFIDLNDLCLTLNLSNNPEEFNVGQNLLIRQHDVPDLWITRRSIHFIDYNYVSDEKLIKDIAETHELQIGYYYVDFLETQKVDLSEYFKRKEAERVVYEALRQANQTGDFDGRNAQIAYSAKEDGSNFTLTWQPGQKYIGFAIDYEAPLDKSAYEWVYIGSVALSVSVKNNKLVVSQQGNAYSATVQNGVLIFK